MEPKLEDYMDWPKIEDLEYAECGNPQEVLGAAVVDGHVLLRCYFPDAEKVSVKVKEWPSRSRWRRWRKAVTLPFF